MNKKQFLKGLIPDCFIEVVNEYKECWCCDVMGYELDDNTWNEMKNNFNEELQDNVLSIYSILPLGAHFQVFLKK